MSTNVYVEQYRQRKRENNLGFTHRKDVEHYDARLAEYDRLTAELQTLNGRTDYSRINAIGYKLRCIEQEFEQFANKHSLAREKE